MTWYSSITVGHGRGESQLDIVQEIDTVTRITVQPGCCKHCGEAYDACKYPVSHGVPTIDAVKLPGDAAGIAARYTNGETTATFTSYERETWDRLQILGHAHF
jgi:hypothetical protein